MTLRGYNKKKGFFYRNLKKKNFGSGAVRELYITLDANFEEPCITSVEPITILNTFYLKDQILYLYNDNELECLAPTDVTQGHSNYANRVMKIQNSYKAQKHFLKFLKKIRVLLTFKHIMSYIRTQKSIGCAPRNVLKTTCNDIKFCITIE